jgi:hypothetical protein
MAKTLNGAWLQILYSAVGPMLPAVTWELSPQELPLQLPRYAAIDYCCHGSFSVASVFQFTNL